MIPGLPHLAELPPGENLKAWAGLTKSRRCSASGTAQHPHPTLLIQHGLADLPQGQEKQEKG